MKSVSEILTGVLSDVIVGVVLAILTWFIGKKYKKILITFWGKISGSGVEYIYKNDEEAAKDITRYSRRSEIVKILSMRAFRIVNDKASLGFLLGEQHPVREVRVLLADPESQSVKERAEEFINIDANYTIDRYVEDIKYSIRQVAANNKNRRLKVRLHSEHAFVRLLITDDYLFLSYFLKDVHGDNSPVYRINRFSPLYESFCRYHNWVWANSSVEYKGLIERNKS